MNECCKQADNLKALPQERSDLIVKECQVCKRKHRRMGAEPGVLGLRLGPQKIKSATWEI